MTTQANANTYLRTRVMTASPEELRLMLLDGALKFAMQGRNGLVNKEYEQVHEGFSQCRAILIELMCTIKEEIDPELAARVRGLYTFIYSELVAASYEKDLARADKAIELLEYERETWALLLTKLAEERAASEATPKPPNQQPEDGGESRSALSIQA